MNWIRWMFFCLLALGVLLVNTGCETSAANVSKTRGVYTTLALTDRELDMPASGYTSYRTFAAGQNPAAVIVGYGDSDGIQFIQQPFTLQLIELASGTLLSSLNGAANYGKATMIPLAIRKSGNYQLKLIIRNAVYDTWDFSVSREAAAPAADSAPLEYAKGDFSATLSSEEDTDLFAEYDNTLLQAILNAATKAREAVNHDLFAQTYPGAVAIQFNVDSTGHISAVTVVDKTLNDDLVQFFKNAFETGAPYPAWLAAIKHAPVRTLTCTFYFD